MKSPNSLWRASLEFALQAALEHLENLDHSAVAIETTQRTLLERFGSHIPNRGSEPEVVVRELVRDVTDGVIGSGGGRFFGWAMGGSLPAALAADWLTSAWDQNAALYSCSPAAAVVEEATGAWLKELFGLPPGTSFAFVTGCQMAHVTCIAAARHSLLARVGWNVERDGLVGAPAVRFVANDQRHGSIERALRLLGLGTSCIVDLPTDAQGRIERHSLEEILQDDLASPTIVLLQAGDFHTGAFDDFTSLIPIAHLQNAWVHVDGAFGLWAAASSDHCHLIKGIASADSWAVDGHKWLNVPFDCGYAFVSNSQSHRNAMSHRASYLIHDLEARDQIDWNPEWSRRARGFATYAALKQLGREGISNMINKSCQHARSLIDGIGNLPGAEVLSYPIINQGVLRFRDLRSDATERDHDCRTDQVIAAVAASGEAFFTGTTWQAKRAMRVSVLNWQTSEADVSRTVEAFRKVLDSVAEGALHGSH